MAIFDAKTGFSIELENYRLECRGEYEGLPLYEVVDGEVTAIAIVTKPAIGHLIKMNNENRTITGPVMIPDLKIFRDLGINGKENCYWYFSRETIEMFQKNFKGQIKLDH